MAHNLNIEDGVASFFGTQPAWHGLGQIVDGAQTSKEAIKLAGLDWLVEKYPLSVKLPTEYKEMEKKFATVRMDTKAPLGIVGKTYTILQNSDAFEFIDNLVGNKQAIFESAGCLFKGERVFITCKLPSQMVVGNDVADCYFFIHNSHDGSRAVELAFTPTFICCNNTLNMALGNAKRKQRVKHTPSIDIQLINSADIMGITKQKIADMQQVFTQMTKVNLNDAQLRKLIQQAMYPEMEQLKPEEYSTKFNNIIDNAFEYITTDAAQVIPERKNTLYGFVQGINGIANHKEYKTASHKVESVIFGKGFENTNRAFELAYQVLQNPTAAN